MNNIMNKKIIISILICLLLVAISYILLNGKIESKLEIIFVEDKNISFTITDTSIINNISSFISSLVSNNTKIFSNIEKPKGFSYEINFINIPKIYYKKVFLIAEYLYIDDNIYKIDNYSDIINELKNILYPLY